MSGIEGPGFQGPADLRVQGEGVFGPGIEGVSSIPSGPWVWPASVIPGPDAFEEGGVFYRFFGDSPLGDWIEGGGSFGNGADDLNPGIWGWNIYAIGDFFTLIQVWTTTPIGGDIFGGVGLRVSVDGGDLIDVPYASADNAWLDEGSDGFFDSGFLWSVNIFEEDIIEKNVVVTTFS